MTLGPNLEGKTRRLLQKKKVSRRRVRTKKMEEQRRPMRRKKMTGRKGRVKKTERRRRRGRRRRATTMRPSSITFLGRPGHYQNIR